MVKISVNRDVLNVSSLNLMGWGRVQGYAMTVSNIMSKVLDDMIFDATVFGTGYTISPQVVGTEHIDFDRVREAQRILQRDPVPSKTLTFDTKGHIA